MAASSSRSFRIKYDAGAGAAVIAGATSDNLTIARVGIDITTKDSAGVPTFIADQIASRTFTCTCEGILVGTQLLTIANSATSFSETFEIDVPGIGEYAGEFGITNFQIGGTTLDGATTFSCEITGNGVIAFTAA